MWQENWVATLVGSIELLTISHWIYRSLQSNPTHVAMASFDSFEEVGVNYDDPLNHLTTLGVLQADVGDFHNGTHETTQTVNAEQGMVTIQQMPSLIS